jgi:hypothetical protein
MKPVSFVRLFLVASLALLLVPAAADAGRSGTAFAAGKNRRTSQTGRYRAKFRKGEEIHPNDPGAAHTLRQGTGERSRTTAGQQSDQGGAQKHQSPPMPTPQEYRQQQAEWQEILEGWSSL